MAIKRILLSSLAGLWLITTALSSLAYAGDNDLVLARYGHFVSTDTGSCEHACGVVEPNHVFFQNLVRDLGQVLAPRLASPADTLGQAGFAVNVMSSLSTIPNEKRYWQLAVQNENPSSTLYTTHVHLRKGLPFSLEIGGNLGHLHGSEMFTLGADVKWAVHEGYKYFPDIALRSTVNTLMGSKDLNLFTLGADVSVSKYFGLFSVLAITPYLGYQRLHTIGSSRVLNAFPQDPRTSEVQADRTRGSQDFVPEFVFPQFNTNANRFFVGSRVNVWIMSFTVEAMFADPVKQVTFAGGVDF